MENGHLGENGESVLNHVVRATVRDLEDAQREIQKVLKDVAMENMMIGKHVDMKHAQSHQS